MLQLIPGNAQHIGARKEQQDSFGFSDMRDKTLVAHGGLLAVVADGMGGLEGGQQSSSVAVQAFLAGYARKTPPEPIPAALHRSLLEANRAVLAVARQSGTEGNTGTTFAAAAMHEDLLYWIATGDSRIYLLRDRQLIQVNADHTYATTLWSAVASGRIARESALSDPQAPHLTSHLGMEELEHIDLSERPYPLVADDVVVVCSDGIYRAMSEGEMAEVFRTVASPSAACEAIKAAVLAKASPRQDNLTILAIQCYAPDRSPALAVAPVTVQAPPRLGDPSNLGLIGMICVELLIAASLGASYIQGHRLAGQKQQSEMGGAADHTASKIPGQQDASSKASPSGDLQQGTSKPGPLPLLGQLPNDSPVHAQASTSNRPPTAQAPWQSTAPQNAVPQLPTPAAGSTGLAPATPPPSPSTAAAPNQSVVPTPETTPFPTPPPTAIPPNAAVPPKSKPVRKKAEPKPQPGEL